MGYVDLLLVFFAAGLSTLFFVFWFSSLGIGHVRAHPVFSLGKIGSSFKAYALCFCISFVLAYGMAFIESYLQVANFKDGVVAGLFFWLVFILPTHLAFVLFAKQKWSLFFYDQFFWLIDFMLIGGVLAG